MTDPGGYQGAIMSKSPRPGTVKTRLCPPLTPAQAARLATAAILDTVAAGLSSQARRVTVVLDGPQGPWLPKRVEVIPQRTGPFGDRLAGAIDDACSELALPVLVIGMDTPQVTGAGLDAAALPLLEEADAVLGPAEDGGYWVIGTNEPHADMFAGVPMSTDATCAAQRAQLHRLGLRVREVATLRDVDDFDDALSAALIAPRTQFAAELDLMLAFIDAPAAM